LTYLTVSDTITFVEVDKGAMSKLKPPVLSYTRVHPKGITNVVSNV